MSKEEYFGTVYLGGPIKGLVYDNCTDWRFSVAQELKQCGILTRSPMRGREDASFSKTSIINEDYLNSTDFGHLNPLNTSKGITIRDKMDVKKCDLVFANLLGAKDISIGTLLEIGWADILQKPIVAVIEKKGNLHDHGMLNEIIGFRAEKIDEGIDLVKRILIH